MAKFIIADISSPNSIPQEIATIVPFIRTTPVVPIKLIGTDSYTMFEDFSNAYTWVLDTYNYKDEKSLINALDEVIAPAEKMANEFRKKHRELSLE